MRLFCRIYSFNDTAVFSSVRTCVESKYTGILELDMIVVLVVVVVELVVIASDQRILTKGYTAEGIFHDGTQYNVTPR